MTSEAFAPAKINLALHVTGRRADGYHRLDSLVAFADIGDRLRVEAADALTLTVTGPFAGDVPRDTDNLVLCAARMLGNGQGAAIHLTKNVPVAAGLGGGSADAAAALRALAGLWAVPLPAPETCLAIGADLPVCLQGRAARMRGIGERLDPVAPLPPAGIVLINPGVAAPTQRVYAGLQCRENAPMPEVPAHATARQLAAWLAGQRNDLEPAARAVAPAVGAVLEALGADPACLLARMTGSGPTCFGLYEDAGSARQAAARLSGVPADWWVRAGRFSRRV